MESLRDLREKDRVFVRHVGDAEWHEFVVTGKAGDSVSVLTADEDHYVLPPEDVEEFFVGTNGMIPVAVRRHGGAVVRLGLRYGRGAWGRIREEAAGLVAEYMGEDEEAVGRGARGALPLREAPAAVPADAPAARGPVVALGDQDDAVWVAAEEIDGLKLGQEVNGDLVGCRLGEAGLVRKNGTVVKVERVSVADAAGYRARRAQELREMLGEPGPAAEAAGGAPAGRGDLRTLAVDYDSQGERFKSWSSLCSEIYYDAPDAYPLEGPASAVFLAKHMERHGRTPKGWVELFIRDKGLSGGDRVVHELRCLAEILELGGTFDQLNVGSLASFEFLCRRIQAVVDAHAKNSQKPDYGSATLFSGLSRPTDGVSPELRSYVARRARDEAEIEKQRQQVRELQPSKDKPK